MLTKEEQRFYDYWHVQREKKHPAMRFYLIGFRNGMIFACAVLLVFVTGWYKRIPFLSVGDWVSIFIGLFLTIIFASVFMGYYRKEQCEQDYQAIRNKILRAERYAKNKEKKEIENTDTPA